MGGVRCLGLFPKKSRFFFEGFPNRKMLHVTHVTWVTWVQYSKSCMHVTHVTSCHVTCVTRIFWILLIINLHVTHVTHVTQICCAEVHRLFRSIERSPCLAANTYHAHFARVAQRGANTQPDATGWDGGGAVPSLPHAAVRRTAPASNTLTKNVRPQ